MEDKNIIRVELASNYAIPEFREVRGKDWICNGEDDNYPQHLITLMDASSKHNAIVTGVSDMIRGDGFILDTTMNPAQAALLNNWLEHPNPFENANDILEKVAFDLKLFGGFYLQAEWNLTGKNIIATYHLPYREMRVSAKGDKFYRCAKYTQWNRKADICFDKFNPACTPQERAGKSQVFFYKQYRPGLQFYPLPDYISCKQNIETDAEISNYHNAEIKSGFSAGTMITFTNGEPTPEGKKAIARMFRNRHQETDNAGGVVINFVDKADQAPLIAALNGNDLDKRYLPLAQTVSDEIFIGHRVTSPMIFGVKTPGQLGGRQELNDAREMFYTDYVKAKVAVIERAFNFILHYLTPGGKVVIQKANSLDGSNTQPVAMSNQLKEADVLSIFEKFGEPANNYRIIKSKRLNFSESFMEEKFLNEYKFAEPLNITIDNIQAKVLGAIKENPSLTVADISDLIGESPVSVNKALKYLSDEGVVTLGETIKITDRGLKTIDEKDIVTTEIFVKYKYSGVKDNRNRPFCAKVLDMDRLYKREDIDNMSDAAGYNIWTQRGGWYHNPSTDVNTPYCRHFWSQVIVKKKTRI